MDPDKLKEDYETARQSLLDIALQMPTEAELDERRSGWRRLRSKLTGDSWPSYVAIFVFWGAIFGGLWVLSILWNDDKASTEVSTTVENEAGRFDNEGLYDPPPLTPLEVWDLYNDGIMSDSAVVDWLVDRGLDTSSAMAWLVMEGDYPDETEQACEGVNSEDLMLCLSLHFISLELEIAELHEDAYYFEDSYYFDDREPMRR